MDSFHKMREGREPSQCFVLHLRDIAERYASFARFLTMTSKKRMRGERDGDRTFVPETPETGRLVIKGPVSAD
jgi:hypothetical protein